MNLSECQSSNFGGPLTKLTSLSEIVGDAKVILPSLQQLMQTKLHLEDAEILDKCNRFQTLCDSLESMVGTKDTTTAQLPLMLVLGQPKSGKSSFINEMLGKSSLRQSQYPGLISQLTKIRYATENTRCNDTASSNDISQNQPTNTPETHSMVIELGLPIELLRESGLDIVDSPGIQDSPPIDCLMQGSSPALIVYVIDACSGFTREVAEDVSQLRFRYQSSQIVFVLNKMDASTAVSEAAGVSRSEAHSAIVDRTISGLEQLGVEVVLSPSKLSASSCPLFCISCRRLGAIRRGLCSNEIGDVDEEMKMWQDSLRSLRSNVACGIGQRLREMVAEAANQLNVLAKLLASQEIQEEDIRRKKRQQWENILNLQKIIFSDVDKLQPPTLIEKMLTLLKDNEKEIAESARAEPAEIHKTESVAISAVEHQVFERQIEVCQKFATIEVENVMRHVDEILATLMDYRDPMRPVLLPKIDREISMKDGLVFEKLERKPCKKIKGKWSKPPWRVETAKQFLRIIDLGPALAQCAEGLVTLMRNAQRDAFKAVSIADNNVNEFLEHLKIRRKPLSELTVECQKLWLRLCSVITETRISAIQWNHPLCIGVGAQGSVVYKVSEADGSRDMVVKKIAVDDEQFSEMAAGLKYCCDATNDSIVPIRAVIIKKLSSEPTVWKLHLWSDLMKQRSLQHQITQFHEQKSASELLKIGLRIAEAIARMHKDGQQHGNLRLSNVFISHDGNVASLADAGQARMRRISRTSETSEFPPEFGCFGKDNRKTCVDVYSLGVILRSFMSTKTSENTALSQLIADCTLEEATSRPDAMNVCEKLTGIISQCNARRN